MAAFWKTLFLATAVTFLSACIKINFVPESSVVRQVTPLAVKVETQVNTGSGVWIASDLVLTAKHVVMSPFLTDTLMSDFKVKDIEGTTHKAEVALVGEGVGVGHDWAILRITSPFVYEHAWATPDCSPRYVGERVVGIGNAFGYTGLLPYLGDVQVPDFNLRKNWSNNSSDWWIHAMLTNMDGAAGVSGGGVFDMDGDLVGIMVGSIAGQHGGSFQQITYPIQYVSVLCGDHTDDSSVTG